MVPDVQYFSTRASSPVTGAVDRLVTFKRRPILDDTLS
jgi:hypothetical protein